MPEKDKTNSETQKDCEGLKGRKVKKAFGEL
jgi:hypothetical protein